MVLASAHTHTQTHTVSKQHNEISCWPSSKVTSGIWDAITPRRSKMLEFPFEMSAEMHRWAHRHTNCMFNKHASTERLHQSFHHLNYNVLTSGSQSWSWMIKGMKKQKTCISATQIYMVICCVSAFLHFESLNMFPSSGLDQNKSIRAEQNDSTYNKEMFATWHGPRLDIAKFWRVSLAIFILLSTNPLKQPNPQFSKNIKQHTGREISL